MKKYSKVILLVVLLILFQNSTPRARAKNKTNRLAREETRYFTGWEIGDTRFNVFGYRQSSKPRVIEIDRDGRHNASWSFRIGYDLYDDTTKWGEFDLVPGNSTTFYKAIVSRTENDQGLQHTSYMCPKSTGGWKPGGIWEDLPPSEWNFRIGFYFRWDDEPWRVWNTSVGDPVMASFRSENMYAYGLNESVWNVYYWTSLDYNVINNKTRVSLAFGDRYYNTRIENFKFYSEHSRNTNFEYGDDSYWSETGNLGGDMSAQVIKEASYNGKYGLAMSGLGEYDYIEWHQDCASHSASWNMKAFMKLKRMTIKNSRASLLIYPEETLGYPLSLECHRNETGKIIWAVFDYEKNEYLGKIKLDYNPDTWYEMRIIYDAEVYNNLSFYVNKNRVAEILGTRTVSALSIKFEVAKKITGKKEYFFFDSLYPIFNEDV